MKLEKVKNTKSKNKMPTGKNLFKKIVAVLLSIAVFSGSYYIINRASAATKDTVEVVRVKAKDGIPKEAVLTNENLEVYSIIRKEYTTDMVLAEDIEEALEKYTTNNLRNGAILHFDEFGAEKPLKNIWLYKDFNEEIIDKEVLYVPFNYLESGGDILTPGDKVRIRIKYEIEETEIEEGIDEEGEPYSRPGKTVKVEANELLFDSIVVADMLNSKGHSIYELYREVLRYPESERQRLLKSSDFLNSIIPKTLVLAADSEQVDKYMEYISSKKAILITLLPRDDNSTILDRDEAFKAEVEGWLENQKK